MVPSDDVLGLDELPILFGVCIDVWCRNLSFPPGQTVSEDVAQYGVGVKSAFRVVGQRCNTLRAPPLAGRCRAQQSVIIGLFCTIAAPTFLWMMMNATMSDFSCRGDFMEVLDQCSMLLRVSTDNLFVGRPIDRMKGHVVPMKLLLEILKILW
jgi:hypothetical protein